MRRFGWPIQVDPLTPRILLPLALLLFVVGNAPAWVMARFLPEAVQLSALSGSIWQGSAARGTLWINGRALSFGSLSWQIAPFSLLTLQPKIAIISGWGGQKMRSTIVFDGIESIVVTDFQAQIEIGFIRQLLPLYVGGQVSLDFAELHLKGGVPQSGTGRIQWRDAAWTAASGDVALGHYNIVVSGNGSGLRGAVETVSGPLEVEGDLQWVENRYAVDLALSGPATENSGLAEALQFLAQPSPNGFDMVLSGTL